MLQWLLASVHLLALGIGLGAIGARAGALRGALDRAGLSRVFLADNAWGIAAALWLATGLWRFLGGFEKGTAYYLHHPLFHTKLALFVAVLLLEIGPMRALMRWRGQLRRGEEPDTSRARSLARISSIQLWLIVAIVFLATALARGLGPPAR
jgi:putative membrane protein